VNLAELYGSIIKQFCGSLDVFVCSLMVADQLVDIGCLNQDLRPLLCILRGLPPEAGSILQGRRIVESHHGMSEGFSR
jgi:hypothetical protein